MDLYTLPLCQCRPSWLRKAPSSIARQWPQSGRGPGHA